MKPGTLISIAGVGLIAAGVAYGAYTYLNDKKVQKKTDSAISDLVAAVSKIAERVKVNAEEAAEKAQEVAEENLKWSKKQWDKLTNN